MSDIPDKIKQLIETSNKTAYRIAKDAEIRNSTLQRITDDGTWGTQIHVADKVLNAIGYKLEIKKIV
jgi:hypothetical protein